MLASIFSLNVIQTALELGCIYALVALALFLSYSILNIADLSTDGCFTLGCAVACQVALTGHPFLALLAAMAAGVCSGFVTAFLQTRLGVESIMAGIIVNTGLYTINLAVMGFSSTMSLVKTETVFSIAKRALSFTGGWYKLVLAAAVIALAGMAMGYLHTYLSCAVGSLFPQHRKLASILSFFALQFLAQILFMLAVYFAATRMEVLLNSFSRFALDLLSSPNGEMKAIFGSLIGVSAVEIVIDAVLWLITQTILTRKLNLP